MFNLIKNISYFLMFIGALNWGLIGIFDFNLVSFIFGDFSLASRITYIVVGVSAIISAITTSIFVRTHCYIED